MITINPRVYGMRSYVYGQRDRMHLNGRDALDMMSELRWEYRRATRIRFWTSIIQGPLLWTHYDYC